MRFLYKIHSSYDGFRPAVIPDRMHGRQLRLGWRHYIDVVEIGWECWIYFHGPHRFENGVYIKGIVDSVDLDMEEVSLRVRDYDTNQPITPPELSERIAEVVAPRFRQVFLWPDEWTVAPQCQLESCLSRRCGDCPIWAGLPLIANGDTTPPKRLRWSEFEDIVPAHWIVPRRCFESKILDEVCELTRRFTAFKCGEMAYAYPFALAIFEQLRRRNLLGKV